jgi:regulator of sigma E protease
MLAVIIFILILGVLIFVHEAGHFFMARRNGIKAEEFGFGFPPRIFGLQRRSGEGTRVLSRKEDVAVEVSSEKIGKTEVVRELALDRIREIVENFSIKKWRFIWGKRNTPEEILNQENLNEGTIYSLNWIPLGGFVKIKGEDGEGKNDADSFAAKNAWVRVKVLAAGVMMNFVLAWVLLSLVFMLGAPEAIDSAADRKIAAESKIQIAEVVASSPADKAGIKIGDEIVKNQGGVVFSSLNDVQQYINSKKGEEINLKIKRGRENLEVKVVPRTNAPEC